MSVIDEGQPCCKKIASLEIHLSDVNDRWKPTMLQKDYCIRNISILMQRTFIHAMKDKGQLTECGTFLHACAESFLHSSIHQFRIPLVVTFPSVLTLFLTIWQEYFAWSSLVTLSMVSVWTASFLLNFALLSVTLISVSSRNHLTSTFGLDVSQVKVKVDSSSISTSSNSLTNVIGVSEIYINL